MSYIPTHSKELFRKMSRFYQAHNSCSEKEALDQIAIANLYPNWNELMNQYEADKAVYNFVMEELVNDEVRFHEDKIKQNNVLEEMGQENKLADSFPVIHHRAEISAYAINLSIGSLFKDNKDKYMSVMRHEMRLSGDSTDTGVNVMTKFAQKIADKALEVIKNKKLI
ncbi:MAG: hypothetical protein AB9919_13150 [Geobacteraceae bacterium]